MTREDVMILTCADDITAGSTLKYTHAGAGKAIGLVGCGNTGVGTLGALALLAGLWSQRG